MNRSKEQLAKKYKISEAECDKVLQYVSDKSRKILLKEWKENPEFEKPNDREVRVATEEFKDAKGILFLKNYENCTDTFIKGIGMMVSYVFKPHSINTPESHYYYHYDAEYIKFCIEEYLTERERVILRARYGLEDGQKRTIEQIRKMGFAYSRQWVGSILYHAERVLLGRYYEKEAKDRKG